MRNWMLIGLTMLFLAACNDEASLTIERETVVDSNVQSLVDQTADDKFASIIYSEQGASYLLLNTQGKIEATLVEDGNDLHIKLTETNRDPQAAIEDIVYKFELTKAYDTIHLFLNDEEIAFEVWYD